MKELLLALGLNEKEIRAYLALLEFGTNPASVIARKVNYPKSTVLFLFDGLVKRGYLRKTTKGKTQYYYAHPQDLRLAKEKEIQEEERALKKALPLLEELKTPFSSEPKVTLFEGISGCKLAYNMILETQGEVLEFGAHEDLVEKFGKDFMDEFIAQRKKRKIFLKAICSETAISKKLKNIDKKSLRDIHVFPKDRGKLYSSLAIFDDKLLVLNLYQEPYALLIQNQEVVETMKTIFRIIFQTS